MKCPTPMEVTYKHMIFLITQSNQNYEQNYGETEEMWITTIVLIRVCKAMCNTALMEKKVSMFLTILLMKMYHPNHIADDQLSLGKKSSFMKNMVIVQMLTVWQVLEELHCLLP